MARSIKYRVRLSSTLAPDTTYDLTPAMLVAQGLDPDGLMATTLSALEGREGTREEPAVFHTEEQAVWAAGRYYDAQPNHALTRSVEVDWEASLAATVASGEADRTEVQADYDRAIADGAEVAGRLRAEREATRYLTSPAGGRWDIVVERGSQGGWRVVGTHYPSGEIREPDGSSDSVAMALLTLGNTIASDWDHEPAQVGEPVDVQLLEALVADYEAAQRNLAGCERAIQDARDSLDVGPDLTGAIDAVRDAASQLEDLTNLAASVEEYLGNAEGELEEAERSSGGSSSADDYLSTASSEADEARGYLGNVDEGMRELKAQLERR